ncbi:hypothetical protein CJ030_MR6G010430 [Morella rubra]|uniref:Uncharacterized protein n=1 Tax=Morella rubra TaxID=262757 RepID=A0A6A1VA83_9ROSI|nr:hypothetical protein CJ030_MR6G010428 [Morella rubra]KAB1209794.1 hypothetical protein CJ030_MR6G010430 [Morella rubra]
MDVDDVTTDPTKSQFFPHAMESKIDIHIHQEYDQFGGHTMEMDTEAAKKGKTKAAAVGGSASQQLCNVRGMATETTKAARRTSSSQPATENSSRIRAHQAKRRASERLRGNVGSG